MLMKKQFQSKSVPRGTRTIWRYLSALFILFTLGIGQMWAAASTTTDGKYATGTIDFSTIGTLSGTTTYWHNGVKFYSGNATSISANNTAWSTSVSIPAYVSNVTAGKDANKCKWGNGGTAKQYTQSGFACSQHTIGIHVNQACTLTVVVNKNLGSDTDDAGITASIDGVAYGTAYSSTTYKEAGSTALTVTSARADKTNASGRYTLTIVVTAGDLTDGEAVVKMFNGSSGSGPGKLFCWESITVTPAAVTKHTVTYKAGDGTGDDVVDSDAKTVKAFADCSFTAPSGYEFKEWQDGSSNVVAAGATVSADMTLTAIYRLIPTKYTVTYSLNGAPGDAPTETSKAEGDAFNLAAAPSWAGHAFDGWLCNIDSDVKAAGSSYTMTAAPTTFTAQWHELDCKIYSFTGGIGSAIKESSDKASVDADKLVLSGSAGVIKLVPAAGETFKAGDVITISGMVGNTAEAFGVKISASNAKGDDLGTASVAGTTIPLIASVALTGNADNLYISRKGGTTTTIYTCEVHRSCAEGVAAGLAYATTEVAKTEGDAAFTNPLTNANGLVIAGYKSSNTAVATVATNGQVTVVGPGSATITAYSAVQTKAGTLYAAGTASYTLTVAALPKYHVTYDLNGGSGEVAEVDHKAGEKFTLHDGVTGVTAPGSKTFVNWKDQDDALFDGGVEYTMPAKDVTLTAQWAGDVYTVKFMDGETVLDTKVVEVGSHPTDIEHPTKPLYTFAAWQLSGSDVVLDDVSGAKDAVVTLTARWAVAYASNVNFKEAATQALGVETALNTYHYASDASDISFEAKGLKIKTNEARFYFNVAPGKVAEIKFGNISGATYSVDGGAAETLSTSQLKATYSASAQSCVMTMTTDAYNIVENVVIHDPYEVSYNVDGGDPVDAQYGYPSVTLPSATRGTDSFVGWFNGDTKIGEAGDSYTPTADITLKAHWEAVSTDARLSAITFSSDAGTLVPAFDPEITEYTYTMPYGTASIPTITGATAVNDNAQTPIIGNAAAAWGGSQTITGVAQSGAEKTYTITMQVAPKDGTSIIKAVATATSQDISEENLTGLYKEAAHISASGSYKFNTKNYFMLQLKEGENFQAGDVVEINVSSVNDATGFAIFSNIVDNDFVDATLIVDTHVDSDDAPKVSTGINKVILPGSFAGSNKLYVGRAGSGDQSDKHLNAGINQVEVKRAMNPVMTAITINGHDGEIDALDDKHFTVTIPNDADLAKLTIVPTIYRNAPHATTSEQVMTNEGAWVLTADGDNTYRVMDKDGDYTDYTITLIRDVLKHTVSFNTHGGSAIADVEVVHGQYLAAAPADPTKDENVFKFWSETEDGAAVDVTTVQINADKEFHAVWEAEPAGIKLINGDVVNHTNFLTGTNETTVEIESVEHKCVDFTTAGSNRTTVASIADLKEFIQYNATTNKAKIKLTLYNTKSSAVSAYLHMLEEGSETPTTEEISIPAGEVLKTDFYEFNSEKNRSFYITCGNRDYIKVLQVKVIDDGTTTLKKAGQVGYSVNTLKSRIFAPQQSAISFEGLTINANAVCKPLSNTALKIKNAYNISFHADAAMTLAVTTEGNQTYYVSTTADGTTNETSFTGRKEFEITAGDWYIHAGSSELKVAKLEFIAPKCEKPEFNALATNSDICTGDPYVELNGTGTVEDDGTVTYKWYAEGADESDPAAVLGTEATYTPSADGKYYVIATNSLAGYSDNVAKSELVTVTTTGSALITSAPKDVRDLEGETATLTVEATGKNLHYAWKESATIDGTYTDVTGAADAASLEVTVPEGVKYYKVVISSDCGDPVEAIAKVEEWKKVTLQDVTASTEWDFSKIGLANNASLASTDTVLANVYGVVNNSEFRSDNILVNANKISGTKLQASKLKFHTTVPGYITVVFSNTGNKDNYRYLVVNGKQTTVGSKSQTNVTYSGAVDKGDVELTVTTADGGSMFNFASVKFEKMDYYRGTPPGRYGTICLPNGGKIYGATLYEVAYYGATSKKIFFDEIINGEMEAGVPYIFQPNGDGLVVEYTDAANEGAKEVNGLVGFIGASENAEKQVPDDEKCYILQNNQYRQVLAGADARIKSNRAYIILDDIGRTEPALAPGRRRISMGVQSEQVATGIGNVQGDEVQSSKVLINGQLFILRGEKMYDATGRLVK